MELQLVQNLKADSNGYIVFNDSVRLDLSVVDTVDYIEVNDILAHRIHLISETVLYSENFADLLIVFNGITNPYYIPAGTILKIPDLQQIESQLLAKLRTQNKLENASTISQNNIISEISAKQNTKSNVSLNNGRIIFNKKLNS
jgi:hypothetical protein